VLWKGDLFEEVSMEDNHEDIRVSNTGFLPIVSAYAAKIGLVEEIDLIGDNYT
jgi:hypothetical protein